MKAVAIRCPNCAATLKVPSTLAVVTCDYCGVQSKLLPTTGWFRAPQPPKAPHAPVDATGSMPVARRIGMSVGWAIAASAGIGVAAVISVVARRHDSQPVPRPADVAVTPPADPPPEPVVEVAKPEQPGTRAPSPTPRPRERSAAQAPQAIVSVTPTSGRPGDTLVVRGVHFDHRTVIWVGSWRPFVNKKALVSNDDPEDVFYLKVPHDATPGEHPIMVRWGELTTVWKKPFTVLAAEPKPETSPY